MVLGLFVTFILVFGWPALSTYIKYEVYIKETHLKPADLTAPAITICIEPVIKGKKYFYLLEIIPFNCSQVH